MIQSVFVRAWLVARVGFEPSAFRELGPVWSSKLTGRRLFLVQKVSSGMLFLSEAS